MATAPFKPAALILSRDVVAEPRFYVGFATKVSPPWRIWVLKDLRVDDFVDGTIEFLWQGELAELAAAKAAAAAHARRGDLDWELIDPGEHGEDFLVMQETAVVTRPATPAEASWALWRRKCLVGV